MEHSCEEETKWAVQHRTRHEKRRNVNENYSRMFSTYQQLNLSPFSPSLPPNISKQLLIFSHYKYISSAAYTTFFLNVVNSSICYVGALCKDGCNPPQRTLHTLQFFFFLICKKLVHHLLHAHSHKLACMYLCINADHLLNFFNLASCANPQRAVCICSSIPPK
ncbi:hypothetical protein POVWA2_046240 [Plasmodium ovale wallikeri]|uniref:Uncharacterized protein n=1 Tax=Plasmodium ovale wallikeri TaxID=864142 RepID=A0A1A8ZIE9_PLAOA|nr:hypothetical protein POVWA1_047310 [Plasmodium ovale wallikeri]SBT43620.1 hypothetical protein POVWA2_046240 [Plasmodium ovale wallikeri]